ncbi:MAG: aldose 1-epimerase family protein [Acetatifactor sp.]
MQYIMENDRFRVTLDSMGAEIKSVWDKQLELEHMWSADPAYWGKTAPFLFPFIGKLEQERFIYEGKVYPADKHGFGQRVEYELTKQTPDSACFRIQDTDVTREKYPFRFELEIFYSLREDGIREDWHIKNTGEKPMYFSVGGHAAFACPPVKEGGKGSRTGQKIRLYGVGNKTELQTLRLNDKGVITQEYGLVKLHEGCFEITEGLFDRDALIFDRAGITAAALCDTEGREYVRVECDAPVWGIWSHPDSGAGYVCLEPWYGICDYAGYEGELSERPHTQTILPGEIWRGGNTMIF